MSVAAEKTADAPETASPAITPYVMVGGEDGVRRIVDRFYDLMDSEPAAASVRAMHEADLSPVRQRLFEFLSTWLGGPPIYHESKDRKCIMSAHAAFKIDAAARDQWMACMRQALRDAGLPEEVRTYLDGPFSRMAEMFRNC